MCLSWSMLYNSLGPLMFLSSLVVTSVPGTFQGAYGEVDERIRTHGHLLRGQSGFSGGGEGFVVERSLSMVIFHGKLSMMMYGIVNV